MISPRTLLSFYMLFITTISTMPNAKATVINEIPLARNGVHAFEFSSDVLDEVLLIEVSLPRSYESTPTTSLKYPISYVADGSATFFLVTAVHSLGSLQTPKPPPGSVPRGLRLPEMITVSIDFKDISNLECKRRQWYTPTAIDDPDDTCPPIGGGADQYLTFIRDELKPFINSKYRVDETQEVYAGHSLTGLLSLYTLFTQPDLFDKYIASSPSNWWDEEIIYQYATEFMNTHMALKKSVYLSVGLDEAGNTLDDPITASQVNELIFSMVFRLGRQLKRHYPDAPIKLQTFANEDHSSIAVPALHNGIYHVFKGE